MSSSSSSSSSSAATNNAARDDTMLPFEVSEAVLRYTLNELDRDEAERIIAAEAGKIRNEPGYEGCSYKITQSKRPEHRSMNRWANIYSYDHSLISDDYLNASLIPPLPLHGIRQDEKINQKSYVASQAPLPNTFPTFYNAIVDHNVSMVVNLTPFKEEGRTKADVYWPLNMDKPWKQVDGYIIVNRQPPEQITNEGTPSEATLYRLNLTSEEKGKSHDFDLLHIATWPDFGIFSITAFEAMIQLIEERCKDNINAPTWVHCSAGIGRSGTVIASLLARDVGPVLPRLVQMDDKDISSRAVILEAAMRGAKMVVDHERHYRPKMVQTPGQLGMVATGIANSLRRAHPRS